MSDLIEALQIFLKYGDVEFPTHCEHDSLYIHGYSIEEMSSQDIIKLEQLGFDYNIDLECFQSFKYGSC